MSLLQHLLFLAISALLFAANGASAACGNEWEQCGGREFTGTTCCKSGLLCRIQTEWYSQCISQAQNIYECNEFGGEYSSAEGLSLQQTLYGGGNDFEGLWGASGVAISDDGINVYATSYFSNSVDVFVRNFTTGTLTRVQVFEEAKDGTEGLLEADGVAVSPDGKNVYVSSDAGSSLVEFSRDAAKNGVLTFERAIKIAIENKGLVVSDDGRNVYLASKNGVISFSRADGKLAQIQVAGKDFKEVKRITLSPDNKHVYATAADDDAIVSYVRKEDGQLQFLEANVNKKDFTGLKGPKGIVCSPDGRHVYVTFYDSDAFALFSRKSDGMLQFIEKVEANAKFNGARDVDVTRDGRFLFLTAEKGDSLCVFSRNINSGSLSLLYRLKNKVGGYLGLKGASGIAIKDQYVYMAASRDDAVSTFKMACDSCPSGSFCPPGDVADLCPPGTANPDRGASVCFACPRGYFTAVRGSEQCKACAAGKFGTDSESSSSGHCQACPKGKFSGTKGSAFCNDCPPYATTRGESGGATSESECICNPKKFRVMSPLTRKCVCAAGYEIDTSSYECRRCKDGKTKPLLGNHPCSSANFVQVALTLSNGTEFSPDLLVRELNTTDGLTSIVVQRIAHEHNNAKEISIVLSARLENIDTMAKVETKIATMGTIDDHIVKASDVALLTSTDLRPSTVRIVPGSSRGTERTLSWTIPSRNKLLIKAFRIYVSSSPERFGIANISISGSDSRYSTKLKVGIPYYFKVGANIKGVGLGPLSVAPSERVTIPCPDGAYCDPLHGTAVEELRSLHGWWKSNYTTNDGMPIFFKCKKNRDACIGAPFNESKCLQGYAGTKCLACTETYGRKGEAECHLCASPSIIYSIAFLGIVFGIAVIVFLIWRTIRSKGKEHSKAVMKLKCLVNHLQITGLIALFPLEWPDFLRRIVGSADVVSASGTSVLSLDCIFNSWNNFDTPFYAQALVTALVPPAAIFLCATFWSLWYARAKDSAKMKRFVQSVIVILFLLHILLLKTALELFTCDELHQGNKFLEADYRIQCWKGTHTSWSLTLGLSMLIVYGLGIPLGAFAAVYRVRHHLGDAEARDRVGFLYSSYTPECWYWELVVALRKSFFAASATLFEPFGVDIQTNIGSLVIACALYLQIRVQPYMHNDLNKLERYAMICEYFTLALSLFLKDTKTTSSSAQTFIVAFIFVVNFSYLLFVMWTFKEDITRILSRLSGMKQSTQKDVTGVAMVDIKESAENASPVASAKNVLAVATFDSEESAESPQVSVI